MANLTPLLDRANGMLRLSRLSVRIRERRHSRWLSVYEVLPGGAMKERAMRGCAAAALGRWSGIVSCSCPSPSRSNLLIGMPLGAPKRLLGVQPPPGPEICEAVVAFQRGQGVNMNLVGPFRGQGYFRLLPPERAATLEDVRRISLHSSESLRAQLEDPGEPLRPMATHRQGFRQKREVVSLLRRAGFGAIAPQELSEELKGLVNRNKQALVAVQGIGEPPPPVGRPDPSQNVGALCWRSGHGLTFIDSALLQTIAHYFLTSAQRKEAVD
jgi:hypothetical protein